MEILEILWDDWLMNKYNDGLQSCAEFTKRDGKLLNNLLYKFKKLWTILEMLYHKKKT